MKRQYGVDAQPPLHVGKHREVVITVCDVRMEPAFVRHRGGRGVRRLDRVEQVDLEHGYGGGRGAAGDAYKDRGRAWEKRKGVWVIRWVNRVRFVKRVGGAWRRAWWFSNEGERKSKIGGGWGEGNGDGCTGKKGIGCRCNIGKNSRRRVMFR